MIRRAEIKDLDAIMQLVKAVVPLMRESGNLQWDEYYPNIAVFQKDVEREQLWVAEIDNDIAGVAAITTDQDAEYAQVGWDLNETAIVVHRLAVSPDYQGRGIAKALLLQAEQEAVENHIGVLRIDTNSHNQGTQALFPKLGYVFAGEIGLAFRPGLRFFCYEKRI